MIPRDLVSAHLPLVRAIAAGMKRSIPFAEMDDLIGYGVIGLIGASQRWRPSKGASFVTFAHYRVRGAMVDGIRRMAGGGRKNHVLLERVPMSFLQGFCEGGLDEHRPSRSRSRRDTRFGELPDSYCHALAVDGEGADDLLGRAQDEQALREAIVALPSVERALVEAVDLREITVEQAGAERGRSKAWASKARTRGLGMLRERLGEKFS